MLDDRDKRRGEFSIPLTIDYALIIDYDLLDETSQDRTWTAILQS